MDFDKKVGEEREQLATQVSSIGEPLLTDLEKGFAGDKSLEFYEGLLAGYAATYQIISVLPPETHSITIGALVAYISEILEERS